MSVLSELSGDCPRLKIIEKLAENHADGLYAMEIVRMTGVSKVTVLKNINELLREGIIKKKRKAGVIQFYQLNVKNPTAKTMLLIKQFINKEKLDD